MTVCLATLLKEVPTGEKFSIQESDKKYTKTDHISKTDDGTFVTCMSDAGELDRLPLDKAVYVTTTPKEKSNSIPDQHLNVWLPNEEYLKLNALATKHRIDEIIVAKELIIVGLQYLEAKQKGAKLMVEKNDIELDWRRWK